MESDISIAIKELLLIVAKLHRKYPQKEFTLHGRLIGDIGEILVVSEYDVNLFNGLHKQLDGLITSITKFKGNKK